MLAVAFLGRADSSPARAGPGVTQRQGTHGAQGRAAAGGCWFVPGTKGFQALLQLFFFLILTRTHVPVPQLGTVAAFWPQPLRFGASLLAFVSAA